MSNLTFNEGLIREHAPEPLDGHFVVVLERAGESGESFHSVFEPGAAPGTSLRGHSAFAVDASRSRSLNFSDVVGMREGGHAFKLQVRLEYFVSDPRLLVSMRQRDPLRQLRTEVMKALTGEFGELPWAFVALSFGEASEEVVATTRGRLQAFAGGHGIYITALQLDAEFPTRGMESRSAGGTFGEPRTEYPDVRDLRRGGLRGEEADGVRESADWLGYGVPEKIWAPKLRFRMRERSEVPTGDKLYRVWYATNRHPTPDGARTGYGARVDERVHFGSCDVAIPASHRSGELGSPWIRRFLSGTDDRLRVHEVAPMEEASFWSSVRECAASFAADRRNALVFIHGFRVSFRDAALRAAQLGYDLNVQGPVAFFSWPSRATLLGYLSDGSAVEASERAMTEFLVRFTRDCGAERVHVIAHSMGNRLLLRALQRIVSAAETASTVRFGHLVLAAPDITRELFVEVADQYRRLSQRTTLYVSDVDNALRASFRLQGARVGLAPPVTCVPGIDTVHVANVDRTLLGHSTFAEARPVLTDIRELLNYDAPPEMRDLVERLDEGSGRYWEVRA